MKWTVMTFDVTRHGMTPPDISNQPQEDLQLMYKFIKIKG